MSGYVSPRRYDANGNPTTSSIRDDIGKAIQSLEKKKPTNKQKTQSVLNAAVGGGLAGFVKGYAAPGGNLTNGILAGVKGSNIGLKAQKKQRMKK
jgi:hypothetical protein